MTGAAGFYYNVIIDGSEHIDVPSENYEWLKASL